MKTKKWRHNPFTYAAMKVKSTHLPHHQFRSYRTTSLIHTISQLIAAQHEQMSLSGSSALQYPTTPQTSLISDKENDQVLTPIIGNPPSFCLVHRIAYVSLSNYANKRHPSQIRRNLRPQKIVGNQKIFVPTIFPSNRHQSH